MRRTWMAAGLIAALPLASGCDRAPTAPTSVPAPAAVVTAPTTLVVAGSTLRLEASAWRDFQPIAPSGGSPLYLVVRLRTTSGSPLPEGIGIDQAWVVHESMAWITAPSPTGAPWGPDVIEFMSREGPRWGPDVPVDVVVRVTGTDGGPKLIAVRQAMIDRTD